MELSQCGAGLVARARARCRAAQARNTERGYRSDWAGYRQFCREVIEVGCGEPPALEWVLAYLEWGVQQGWSPRTLRRRVAGLRSVWDAEYGLHHAGRHGDVDRWVEGMLRTVVRPVQRARALSVDDMEALSAVCGEGLEGARDRALLLLGFAGGFRRSELAALEVGDVEVVGNRLRVVVRRGKGDQRRQGHVKVIGQGERAEVCAVRAVRTWLRASGVTAGRLFRRVVRGRRGRRGVQVGAWVILDKGISGEFVNLRLKALAEAAGLEGAYSAHSLRAGCVTAGRSLGLADGEIQRLTGHRDRGMIERYDRGDVSQAVSVLRLRRRRGRGQEM